MILFSRASSEKIACIYNSYTLEINTKNTPPTAYPHENLIVTCQYIDMVLVFLYNTAYVRHLPAVAR